MKCNLCFNVDKQVNRIYKEIVLFLSPGLTSNIKDIKAFDTYTDGKFVQIFIMEVKAFDIYIYP